jgi:hypothetical protein
MNELLEECLEERAAGWPERGWFTAFFHAVYVVVVVVVVVVVERSRVPPTATTTDALSYTRCATTINQHQEHQQQQTQTAALLSHSVSRARPPGLAGRNKRTTFTRVLHSASSWSTTTTQLRERGPPRASSSSATITITVPQFRALQALRRADSPTARANIYSDAKRPTRHRLVPLAAVP